MGGAINTTGNLYPSVLPKNLFSKKAEWNAFWDPSSIEWIFKNTSFPITMLPLNVTNYAPITEEFMQQLSLIKAASSYAQIAWESYRLITGLSKENQATYEMWDVVAASYLGSPDLYEKPRTMKLKIITEGTDQGTIIEDQNGREVNVVLKMKNKQDFYKYVLKKFSRI
jgi:purine nucleosidase